MATETEEKVIAEDPDGWTAQDLPWPAPEEDLALAPQQFAEEQLPDPEGAKNAGVPEIEIPEGQVSDDIEHPNGPEPDELLTLGKIEELPERETVETSNVQGGILPDAWTVQNPEIPEEETAEAEDETVDLEAMTKAEIQDWAEANGYEGLVNKDTQSKAEMIEAIVG